MADRTLKTGDTWPVLRGTAGDAAGVYDLSTADQVQVFIRHSSGTPSIVADVTPINPATNDGWNWEYPWQLTDTDVVGSYDIELKITWDSVSTPPKIQTVPNSGFLALAIEDDLE